MRAVPKFQWVARGGYAARAAVFFLVGGLALFSGVAGGGSDTKSALDTLLAQAFGQVWVGIIALGLIGFVIWRLAQSIGNADQQDPGIKGIAKRIALFGSAVAYVGLAWYALDRAIGSGSQSNGGSEKGLAEWAMSQPFGKYLAAAIGIGFVIGGLVTIAKGWLRTYERFLSAEARGSRPVTIASIYGLSARGVLFAIVGMFFIYAAINVAPQQAGSIGDALNWIRGLPFGGVLYALVALGLASFGAYNLILARYRIVHAPAVAETISRAARSSTEFAGLRH